MTTSRLPWGAAVLIAVTAAGCGSTNPSAAPQPAPSSAMAGAALAYDPALDVVIAAGGPSRPGQAALGTWAWDGQHWKHASVHGPPPERISPLLATDPSTGGVLLVGGTTGGTSTTSCPPTTSPTRSGGQPALCTGVATPVSVLSDVWTLRDHTWTRLAATGTVPEQGQLLASAPSLDTVVVVGRTHALTPSATPGTWRWTQHGWSLLTATAPDAADSMAADPITGHLIAYGGQEPFTPAPGMGAAATAGYTRTWELTDGGWQQLRPATVPERAPGVLTLAPDGQHLLLITTAGHPWSWTGTTWQPYPATREGGQAPSWPGSRLSAATNPHTGTVVVLAAGGQDGDTTWTLTGHEWRRHPATP